MMTLYSGTTDPYSQRCRFVLYEKGSDFKIVDVDMFSSPEELKQINPYGRVPVLIERNLVLFEANIINEYIDERFPFPELMSNDVVKRARTRLHLYRFDYELFRHIGDIEQGPKKVADIARQAIKDYLIQVSDLIGTKKYITGNEICMLDIAIAPLLWRLNHYGIEMGNEASPLMNYAERLFARPAFIASMTPAEKALRK